MILVNGPAGRSSPAAHFEAQPRKMHDHSSGAGIFAGDRDPIASRRIQLALDRLGARVGGRHHDLLAGGDAVGIGADSGRGDGVRVVGDGDRGTAVEFIMSTVAKCAHTLAPRIQPMEGLGDLRRRTAAHNEPQAVIQGEIRDARFGAEEKSMLADHFLQTLQV